VNSLELRKLNRLYSKLYFLKEDINNKTLEETKDKIRILKHKIIASHQWNKNNLGQEVYTKDNFYRFTCNKCGVEVEDRINIQSTIQEQLLIFPTYMKMYLTCDEFILKGILK